MKADDPLHCDYAKLNDRFDFSCRWPASRNMRPWPRTRPTSRPPGASPSFTTRSNAQSRLAGPGKRHALNQFLTRVLFCMFAEDTGSFPQDLFVKTISEFGGADGEHLRSLLKQLFDIMNVPENRREGLPAHIRAFPYVNGGLFADGTEVPAFNKRAKRMLVEAAQLDWKEINPDIFGSMIQAVVDPGNARRPRPALHLRSQHHEGLAAALPDVARGRVRTGAGAPRGALAAPQAADADLEKFASSIRPAAPATSSSSPIASSGRWRCASSSGSTRFPAARRPRREQSGVRLSSFYGIELADFAAETAKLSLWIAEYQMNQRFKTCSAKRPRTSRSRKADISSAATR